MVSANCWSAKEACPLFIATRPIAASMRWCRSSSVTDVIVAGQAGADGSGDQCRRLRAELPTVPELQTELQNQRGRTSPERDPASDLLFRCRADRIWPATP